MMFEPVQPYISPQHRVKFAIWPWEREGAARLRRAVFCDEQGIFDGDDRDAIDDRAVTIVALSDQCGWDDEVVGTVRIHSGDAPGEWWGSRLAVCKEYRRQAGLGTSLIRLAVSSAHAQGATRFLANVQSRNVLLFQRLHWTSLGETSFHGHPHHHMQADLSFYPPILDGATGFVTRTAEIA
ncbi:MSMEG_0567/Sll0786 family nitrogen starvation N-acetyltransferase [Mesorhizobium sp. NZP2077]|uniref:MSMEG_0567/Sll0786 family nitrogen starvation N-acetyltransferase n=1 Tax=Mesorhizobium sp. NZP2077 TaxID=2483404 RepID=UPI0015546204|nr:MSMEG_0567/Sll0786 family nitrogen starvation N-acetyltransferase [Mesorhizobium sp. NZP2077]